jgi:O-antigen/teichoic acid export membrane protein
VAAGIVAAPFASLLVIPAAVARRATNSDERRSGLRSNTERSREDWRPAQPAGHIGFAGSVAAIQLAEQTLLNAAVLVVGSSVAAGVIFSALLIARAPLQLFQAIQTSLLPHLASLEATAGHDEFERAIRVTLRAIALFAGTVAAGLLAIGPWAMDLLFGADADYGRVGLAVIATGMGFHLAAGTLNQAALARGRAAQAAAAWLACAVAFVVWMVVPIVDDQLIRAEVGYAGAAALLCAALWTLERPSPPLVDRASAA